MQSIKNVMSDRHIVQKNFNKIFQEYRATVLPDVIKDWANLSEEVKTKIKQVNEFFCGMHYVVGLADQTETALKAWEKLLFDDMPVGSIANGGYIKVNPELIALWVQFESCTDTLLCKVGSCWRF